MRTLTFSVLQRLADGDFHSGEALARSLDVSRGTIWNAVNEALAIGLPIHRVHGRGYRLIEPLDWLDAERIGAAVRHAGLDVQVVPSCGSTNAELMIAAEHGAPSGRVLAAEWQTQGRGRLGRAWHSGIASALTFSLLWRFDKAVAGLAGLSLAVGVAIVRTLRRASVAAQLKWPNDLVWQERKLGGILIELRGDALGPCATVIGIGLNVRLGENERRRIDQPVADLTEAAAVPVLRSDWLVAVLLELASVLRDFGVHGFAAVREEWTRYHLHQDRPVELSMPDGTRLQGVATGVDASGCLLISTPGGTRAVLAGDVSLRAGA